MTPLRKRMLEELQRRNYSPLTIQSYLHAVEDFARYFKKSPDQLNEEHMREYHLHLVHDLKLATNTIIARIAALRFLFVKPLRRPYVQVDLPRPKTEKRLPTVLSREEVGRLIDSASNLLHYAILMTLYATGLRRAELCGLKVADIDSQRMVLHVRQGKGKRDRDLPMTPKLLETLREYWRWMKPKTYLFPGMNKNWRADKPLSPKAIYFIVRAAAKRAGISKPVSPHCLRHTWATHLLESGEDLRKIQLLLGHSDLETTSIYLHLSQSHLHSVANPVEAIPVSALDTIKRSGRKKKE